MTAPKLEVVTVEEANRKSNLETDPAKFFKQSVHDVLEGFLGQSNNDRTRTLINVALLHCMQRLCNELGVRVVPVIECYVDPLEPPPLSPAQRAEAQRLLDAGSAAWDKRTVQDRDPHMLRLRFHENSPPVDPRLFDALVSAGMLSVSQAVRK